MIQEKIAKAKRILIKIGTATITKDKKVNTSWLKEKVKEFSELKKQGKEILIVTSGAVGAGMEIANLTTRPKDTLQLQLLSGKGQVRLMKLYKDYFKEHNVQIGQVLLTHHNFDSAKELDNIKKVLDGYLTEGTIPIINTNDVVTNEELMSDSEHKFTDNDELAALVSEHASVDLLLILTDVDGLCTKDPRKNESYMLIKLVEKITPKVEEMATCEGTMMGTGGMLSKIRAAKAVAKKGIITVVGNGKYDVKDILGNKVDRTIFLGQ